MAEILKREDTRYPGIQKLTYVSGTQAYDVHVVHNGKHKAKRFRIPVYKLQDARDWQIEQSDRLRRHKSGYDDSLYQKTRASHMLDCYLNGGFINGRQAPGGFSYRNYLTKKPFGSTDKTNINTAINLLKADPALNLPLADFRTQAASDFVDALALRE